MVTEDVLNALVAKNLQPAGFVDLLAFAITYPETQRDMPVLALGATWENKPENKLVPALWGGAASRELNLCSISTKWVGEDRFLVFK